MGWSGAGSYDRRLHPSRSLKNEAAVCCGRYDSNKVSVCNNTIYVGGRRKQALAALAAFVADTAARSDLTGQTGWQQHEGQALRVLARADDLIRLSREFVEVVVNHNQVLSVECQRGT